MVTPFGLVGKELRHCMHWEGIESAEFVLLWHLEDVLD